MSLARLMGDTSFRDEARPMLAAIYNWFTEGFDTADLIDAKTLLGEPSQWALLHYDGMTQIEPPHDTEIPLHDRCG